MVGINTSGPHAVAMPLSQYWVTPTHSSFDILYSELGVLWSANQGRIKALLINGCPVVLPTKIKEFQT